MTLLMNKRGRVFAGFDEVLRFLGNSGIQAINILCQENLSRRSNFADALDLTSDVPGLRSKGASSIGAKAQTNQNELQALLDDLTKLDPEKKLKACFMIGQSTGFRESAVNALIGLLSNANSALRRNAAAAIGNLANLAQAISNGESLRIAVDPLLDVLQHDPDEETQHFAGFALGNIGQFAGAAVPILQHLDSTANEMRHQMISAIIERICSG